MLCCPGTLLRYFVMFFSTIPVAPITIGTTSTFFYHILWHSVCRSTYFDIFSVAFLYLFIYFGITDQPSHTCMLCSKQYKCSASFQRHLLEHTGERPHLCPENNCSKTFKSKKELQLHMTIHSGKSKDRPSVVNKSGTGSIDPVTWGLCSGYW